MMTKDLAPLALCAVLAACNTTSSTSESARADSVPLPETLRLVGETAAGQRAFAGMESDGIGVSASLEGRKSGLAAFCTGAADAVALDSSMTDAEAVDCREKGMADGVAWSAFGPLNDSDAAILYMRYRYAEDFLARSSDYN